MQEVDGVHLFVPIPAVSPPTMETLVKEVAKISSVNSDSVHLIFGVILCDDPVLLNTLITLSADFFQCKGHLSFAGGLGGSNSAGRGTADGSWSRQRNSRECLARIPGGP